MAKQSAIDRKSDIAKVRQHVIDRAFERYRIRLTVTDLVEMAGLLKTDDAVRVRRKSNKRSEWLVNFRGDRLRVGYGRGLIRTVMPLKKKHRAMDLP